MGDALHKTGKEEQEEEEDEGMAVAIQNRSRGSRWPYYVVNQGCPQYGVSSDLLLLWPGWFSMRTTNRGKDTSSSPYVRTNGESAVAYERSEKGNG